MTDLENILLIKKICREKMHVLEYGDFTFIGKMDKDDRKGFIYIEGKGLHPINTPSDISIEYIFDNQGEMLTGEELMKKLEQYETFLC